MSDERNDEDAIIEAQLGRRMRARSTVVSRCHLRLPVVVQVPPVLQTGEPFPTLYWLTCPLAHRRIARLEADGGVRAADARARDDAEFAKALEGAHARYREERDALLEDEGSVALVPTGGVGGSRGGTKCLHAHFAHYRARPDDNALGRDVAGRVEPLDCKVPCVLCEEGTAGRNPEWREPRRS